MWKFLGLVLFCSLLNSSEGKKPAIYSTFSEGEFQSIMGSELQRDGLLQNHLKGIALPDIQLEGLLGLLGKLSGLKIANVERTGHKVIYVPELGGVEVTISVRLDITGSALFGFSSTAKISVELQFRIRYQITDYQAGSLKVVFQECNIWFGNITIQILNVNLSASALSTIQNSIISNINQQICNILTVVFDVVKEKLLGTMNVVIPFAPYGSLICQLASLPFVENGLAKIDLFVDLDILGQGRLSIPDSAANITLPLLQSYRHCHCLHSAFLNIFLSVVVKFQPQELSCTPNVFSGADALRAAILALIPDGPPPFISTAILYFRITLLQGPVLQLGNGFAAVQVSVQIEFYVKNLDGSITSIVILQDSLSLSVVFSVANSRVFVAVSISGHKVAFISSGVGITDISTLEPHCGSLLGETFLVSLNGFFSIGLPLPSILNAVVNNAVFQFIENGLLLCI